MLIFVIAVLMTAEIWLYKPIAPLTEALDSYWLVIHVVSAVIATGAPNIAMMPSPTTRLTVPPKRRTASTIASIAGLNSSRARSGSSL